MIPKENNKIQTILFRENRNPPKFKGELRSVEVFVDRLPLTKLIADMAIDNGFSWQDQRDTIVCLEFLHESADKTGKFPILVGSHCLINGLVDAADVSLCPVDVEITDNTIRWRIQFLAPLLPDNKRNICLEFFFDRAQFLKALNSVPKETRFNS